MTPAWAAAMAAAHLASSKARRAGGWSRLADEDYEAIARAALPHALRAVVEGMDEGDLGRVWAMGTGYWHSTRDMPKPVSGPATGAATGMCFPDQMRAALLAALTTAALRAAKGE